MMMERVRLNKAEKTVLRMVANGIDHALAYYPEHKYNTAAHTLSCKGLVNAAFVEGGGVEAIRLTDYGRQYLSENPMLRNPIGWRWVISTAIAIAGIAIALLVSFSLMNK